MSFAERHSVAAYFALTYAISWAGALVVAASSLTRDAAAVVTIIFGKQLAKVEPAGKGVTITA